MTEHKLRCEVCGEHPLYGEETCPGEDARVVHTFNGEMLTRFETDLVDTTRVLARIELSDQLQVEISRALFEEGPEYEALAAVRDRLTKLWTVQS